MGRACTVLLFLLVSACVGDVRYTRPSDGPAPDTRSDVYPDVSEQDLDLSDLAPDNNTSVCNDQEAHLNGYCYRALGVGVMTYSMGKSTCETAGYQPISIHSDEENQLVFDLLYMWTSCSWLGMTRDGDELRWEDGTPLDYENWEPNEPGSYGCFCIGGPAAAAEDQGLWQDVPCTKQYREIVCKRKP